VGFTGTLTDKHLIKPTSTIIGRSLQLETQHIIIDAEKSRHYWNAASMKIMLFALAENVNTYVSPFVT